MADLVAAAYEYRRMLVSLAMMPDVIVTLRGGLESSFPYTRVVVRLNGTRWDFALEAADDKAKVVVTSDDISGSGHKRRVKTENVPGTVMGLAAQQATKRADVAARQAEHKAQEIARVEAFRTEYADVIEAANKATKGQRLKRFERHPIAARGQGHFEFYVSDSGQVSVEISTTLRPGERESMLPVLVLLRAVADKLLDAQAAAKAKVEALAQEVVNG